MKKILIKYYRHFALNALVSGDYKKSAGYLKKILKKSPYEKGINYNYAVCLIGSGDYDDAEKYLLKETEITGESFEILKTLGDICYLNSRPEKAKIYFEKAMKKSSTPKDKSSIRKKILILKDQKKYKKMLNGYSLYEEGVSFLHNRNWIKAEDLFLQALNLDKENPFIYNNLGVIYMMHKKDFSLARDYFGRALEYSDLPSIKVNYQKADSLINQT